MEFEKDIKSSYSLEYTDRFAEEDLENRRLFINDDISKILLDDVAYKILRYNWLDKGIEAAQRKPIVLFINSPGGSVIDGFGLIDAIRESETPVYTVNMAECASMGLFVFLAGVKRFAMPHSTFLMHDGFSWGGDSTAKLQDRLKFETEQMAEVIKQYVISTTKITSKMFDKKYRVEWYFMPKEAKEVGVVDYIIGQDCKLSDIL